MSMAFAVLVLAVQPAGAPPAVPPPMWDAFIVATRPFVRLGVCTEEHDVPGLDDLANRYYAARRNAGAVWGQDMLSVEWRAFGDEPPSCDPGRIAADTAEAEQALADYLQVFVATLRSPAYRGAWVGPLRMCRDTVVRVKFSRDQYDQVGLLVEFRPSAGADFARLTRDNVGRQLALRFDDTIVSTPTVNEPILGGSMHVSGDVAMLGRFRAAIAAPC